MISYSPGQEPGLFQTYIYNPSYTLKDAYNWISENTRYVVSALTDKLLVIGGTEEEWKEIQKHYMFANMTVTPDVIIPLSF